MESNVQRIGPRSRQQARPVGRVGPGVFVPRLWPRHPRDGRRLAARRVVYRREVRREGHGVRRFVVPTQRCPYIWHREGSVFYSYEHCARRHLVMDDSVDLLLP